MPKSPLARAPGTQLVDLRLVLRHLPDGKTECRVRTLDQGAAGPTSSVTLPDSAAAAAEAVRQLVGCLTSIAGVPSPDLLARDIVHTASSPDGRAGDQVCQVCGVTLPPPETGAYYPTAAAVLNGAVVLFDSERHRLCEGSRA